MLIIGSVYHPSMQQIAYVDTGTGEGGERRLMHRDGFAKRRTRDFAFDIEITERTDLAMVAIQGPEARARFAKLLSPAGAQSAPPPRTSAASAP